MFSRALRDPLYRSNERVKCAKGKAYSDLAPRQQNLQDWDPPGCIEDDKNAVRTQLSFLQSPPLLAFIAQLEPAHTIVMPASIQPIELVVS